nr:MAG TPA: hypothetical protein [Caudoviricetes sp.]
MSCTQVVYYVITKQRKDKQNEHRNQLLQGIQHQGHHQRRRHGKRRNIVEREHHGSMVERYRTCTRQV